MDIVDNINRYLAGDKTAPKAVKSRLTKARDEIVMLRAELAALKNQDPVGYFSADSHGDWFEVESKYRGEPLYAAAGAKEKTE